MRWWWGLVAAGCATSGTGTDDPDGPTWHGDVAPIVAEHCAGCHQAGSIGGFSLTTYEEAAPFAIAMADAVRDGRMPPWPAVEAADCTPRHAWEQDLRLTGEEIDLIGGWADAGAPAGEVEPAPGIPEVVGLEAPSAELRPTTSFTVEGEADQYMCFSLDPELDEEVWVTGLQVVPDDPEVVHHALVFADAVGASAAKGDAPWPCFGGAGVEGAQLLQPWTPGQLPYETPEGVGFPLPAGARLIVSLHYHPVPGEARPDSTGLDVRWSTEATEQVGRTVLVGNSRGLQPGPADTTDQPEFRIPAGSAGHTETIFLDNPRAGPTYTLYTVGGHMHWVGTAINVRIERETGSECLLNIPSWDFNWQGMYRYDADFEDLPTFGPGERLVVECTYDNTMANPFVQDVLVEQGLSEPIDVGLGEETTDEMCLTMLGVVPSFPALP